MMKFEKIKSQFAKAKVRVQAEWFWAKFVTESLASYRLFWFYLASALCLGLWVGLAL